MCSSLLILYVFVFLQGCESSTHRLLKRSPQQIDIQSIRQKQISPDITVVDVVVNEPVRRNYPNQNTYIQTIPQQQRYPNQGNFYPNNQYQNVPNRRQPEIQIIEVVDPRPQPVVNVQPWPRYPQGNQFYPNNNPFQGGNGPNRRPNRPNGRPYRPNSDFHIPEENNEDDFRPGPPPNRGPPGHGHRGPGHRGPKPKPPKSQDADGDSSEEEDDKYVFDAGEGSVIGYTKDNFPIIPLRKNDIRR